MRIPPKEMLLAEKAKRSLYEFVKQSWPIFEPANPYRDNWHIGAICEHLEAVTRGEIQNLIINIPPGHAKSLLVAVAWPAWVWSWRPQWRSIFTSYARQLAIRDSVRCRQVIESPWYVRNFMRPEAQDGWGMQEDSNRKEDFGNTRSGRRLSTAVDGSNTGERGDTIVADDPNNVADITSEVHRAEVKRWWTQVMSSRLNDLSKGQKVIIQQRMHADDLTGHMLRAGGYEHLCLPSLFVPRRKSYTFVTKRDPVTDDVALDKDGKPVKTPFWEDPRTEPDELLFEGLFPKRVLDDMKKPEALGITGFAGQYQQTPSAEEGGMFKRSQWRWYKPDGVAAEGKYPRPEGCWEGPAVALPQMRVLFLSLDAAFKDGKKNDYVVFEIWGISGANRYLLDLVRERMSFTRTCEVFKMLSAKWPLARHKLVEDAANGAAIVDSLSATIPGIIAIKPEGGKEARAAAMQPWVEAGNVYLPEGAPWIQAWVDEFADFPNGTHDDQVDAASQFMLKVQASPAMARAIGMSTM